MMLYLVLYMMVITELGWTTKGISFMRIKLKHNPNHPTTTNVVSSSSCQIHPSEYAYRDDSVTRFESGSANCRRYSDNRQVGLSTDQYIHCNGIQRKLTDSDLGGEQYQPADYYAWIAGKDVQLLFIFPLRVSLTTITLHYYSDSDRGLPRLRFYAVPDDYNIWNSPNTNYASVDVAAVPPGRERAGRKNVSTTVNFNTRKVLMYKSQSNFNFVVSEVEFFDYMYCGKYIHVHSFT